MFNVKLCIIINARSTCVGHSSLWHWKKSMWLRLVMEKSIINIAPIMILHCISKHSIKFQVISKNEMCVCVASFAIVTGHYASLSSKQTILLLLLTLMRLELFANGDDSPELLLIWRRERDRKNWVNGRWIEKMKELYCRWLQEGFWYRWLRLLWLYEKFIYPRNVYILRCCYWRYCRCVFGSWPPKYKKKLRNASINDLNWLSSL